VCRRERSQNPPSSTRAPRGTAIQVSLHIIKQGKARTARKVSTAASLSGLRGPSAAVCSHSRSAVDQASSRRRALGPDAACRSGSAGHYGGTTRASWSPVVDLAIHIETRGPRPVQEPLKACRLSPTFPDSTPRRNVVAAAGLPHCEARVVAQGSRIQTFERSTSAVHTDRIGAFRRVVLPAASWARGQ
jgi:hypothetical protein